jgi:hypothetical protein
MAYKYKDVADVLENHDNLSIHTIPAEIVPSNLLAPWTTYFVTQHDSLPCHWHVGFPLPRPQHIVVELLILDHHDYPRANVFRRNCRLQLARHDYVPASADGSISSFGNVLALNFVGYYNVNPSWTICAFVAVLVGCIQCIA